MREVAIMMLGVGNSDEQSATISCDANTVTQFENTMYMKRTLCDGMVGGRWKVTLRRSRPSTCKLVRPMSLTLRL